MKNAAAATQRIIRTAAAAIGPVIEADCGELEAKIGAGERDAAAGEGKGEPAATGRTFVYCAAEPPMTPQAFARVKGVAK